MFRTLFILAAFYCVAVFCSCQKEVEPYTPGTDSSTTDEGYMPLTAGTYWVYEDTAAAGYYDTTTVLGETTVLDSITFIKVQSVSAGQEDDGYYGVNNHNYYLNGSQSGVSLTMLVLNDTASVGYSWVYDMGNISGVPAKGTGTIKEKLSSYTVQAKTYNDVIHSQYVISFNLLGTFTDFATYDFYFAKGVGIVQIKSTVSDVLGGGGDEATVQNLVDYSIK